MTYTRFYVLAFTIPYIVIKAWGVAFAAWSWWWILVPIFPIVWLAFKHLGLL